MEEKEKNPEVEEQGYVERPAWQVWAARIGLIVFLIIVALGYAVMFRGG